MRDSSSSYSLHPFWLMGTINRLEPSLESSCYSWFWPLPWPSACWFFVPSTRSSSRVRCMTSSFVITKLALECFAGGSSPSFFNRARARRKSSWTQMSWKAWRTLETSSRVSRRLKLETSGRWIGQKEIWNKIPLMRVWRKHICLSCRYQIKGIAAFRGLTSTNRLRRLALTVSLILHTVHRCTSRSEALVIVASKQILTRPWCAVEMCSAVANKVMACHVADISRDWCSFCASHVSFVKWTRGCSPQTGRHHDPSVLGFQVLWWWRIWGSERRMDQLWSFNFRPECHWSAHHRRKLSSSARKLARYEIVRFLSWQTAVFFSPSRTSPTFRYAFGGVQRIWHRSGDDFSSGFTFTVGSPFQRPFEQPFEHPFQRPFKPGDSHYEQCQWRLGSGDRDFGPNGQLWGTNDLFGAEEHGHGAPSSLHHVRDHGLWSIQTGKECKVHPCSSDRRAVSGPDFLEDAGSPWAG